MDINIHDEVACVERELKMRCAVYPRLVKLRKMTGETALRQIEIMQAVLDRLKEIAKDPQPGDQLDPVDAVNKAGEGVT